MQHGQALQLLVSNEARLFQLMAALQIMVVLFH